MSLIDVLENREKTERFNNYLMSAPLEWRGPVVDVIDTFEIVKKGLSSIGIDDPYVLVEAARMAIERHDKSGQGDTEPTP
jgi:hypothetical protein